MVTSLLHMGIQVNSYKKAQEFFEKLDMEPIFTGTIGEFKHILNPEVDPASDPREQMGYMRIGYRQYFEMFEGIVEPPDFDPKPIYKYDDMSFVEIGLGVASLADAEARLAARGIQVKDGCIFDPDGDRVRFYDGTREIDMNRFGAIAFHYMVTWRKEVGVVAKSVATSNFVNVIASKLGIPVMETPVGFKNFRPWLSRKANPKALIAFEESDGISGLNNTLEKDAQFGLLLALEIMATTGKNLGEYLDDLYKEFGKFYPNRAGFEVDKSLVGAPLAAQVMAVADKAKVGSKVKIGEKEKSVREVLTLDGVKIIFEDDSWMLIRPSGTEPKVRIYTECREESEKDAMFEAAKALFFGK